MAAPGSEIRREHFMLRASCMRYIYVVGIGSGNPEHMTVQAINALNKANVIFLVDKGADKSALAEVRKEICDRFITHANYRVVTIAEVDRHRAPEDYRSEVEDWHAERARRYASVIQDELAANECAAFLVWGDPAWYDSTTRILQTILHSGAVEMDYEIIPGISSFQVLAAKHRIPLNEIGEPVVITTGRKLLEDNLSAVGNTVVMLDGKCAFKKMPPEQYEIFWGAYLGMQNEMLHSGLLGDVADDIANLRERERASNGWIMDTYLLRRIKL